jgi:hypothetical protein
MFESHILFAGHELGYMLGAVYALKGEAARDAGLVSSKQLRTAEEISTLIEEFSDVMEGPELQESLLRIRNKFKLLAASVPVIQHVRKPATSPTFEF